jgi:hypothetical protein
MQQINMKIMQLCLYIGLYILQIILCDNNTFETRINVLTNEI